MTAPEPTLPLTDEELDAMRGRHKLEWIEPPDYVVGDFETPWCGECGEQHPCEVVRALNEVDRLRAELAESETHRKDLSRRLDQHRDDLVNVNAEIARIVSDNNAQADKLDKAERGHPDLTGLLPGMRPGDVRRADVEGREGAEGSEKPGP